MTSLEAVADSLNRTVKILLDNGEASSLEEAERIFAQYRLQIVVGPDVARNTVLQAALLTAVNCASRTFLGGVSVVGATGPLCVRLPSSKDLRDAVVQLGGQPMAGVELAVPTVLIGDVETLVEPLAIRATFTEWCGGVIPMARQLRLAERGNFTPAGVLAGAIAVAEMFQRVRGGNPFACRRSAGLDLWCPKRDWLRGEGAAKLDRLPSSACLIGLGNLGQSYLWVMGLLPYADIAANLVLQDMDVLAPANLSTSLLTTQALLGMRKTRAMAQWAEARGFRTTIIERKFEGNFQITPQEAPVALVGVDNGLARQDVESVGFTRVIEAGLGAGPQDFMGIDVHTLPATRTSREMWQVEEATDTDIARPAYTALLQASQDRCGTVRLAGRSVGAPFVGATAACLVIAELVRLTLGGERHELISCHLRELTNRIVIAGQAWSPFNPGTILLAV